MEGPREGRGVVGGFLRSLPVSSHLRLLKRDFWLLHPMGPWSPSHHSPPHSHVPRAPGLGGPWAGPKLTGTHPRRAQHGAPSLAGWDLASSPVLRPHSDPHAPPDDDPVTGCSTGNVPRGTERVLAVTRGCCDLQALRRQQVPCPRELGDHLPGLCGPQGLSPSFSARGVVWKRRVPMSCQPPPGQGCSRWRWGGRPQACCQPDSSPQGQ